MIIFETERLIVRQYTVDDTDAFFQIHGDGEVMRYIRSAKTKEECDQFLKEILAGYEQKPGMGRWAVEEKSCGFNVGTFCIIPIANQPGKIQLGYALIKEHWGKGYATELTKTGLKFAFDNLELEVMYGVTEMENIASQRVLLKAGFNDSGMYVENDKDLLEFSIQKKDWAVNGSN